MDRYTTTVWNVGNIRIYLNVDEQVHFYTLYSEPHMYRHRHTEREKCVPTNTKTRTECVQGALAEDVLDNFEFSRLTHIVNSRYLFSQWRSFTYGFIDALVLARHRLRWDVWRQIEYLPWQSTEDCLGTSFLQICSQGSIFRKW